MPDLDDLLAEVEDPDLVEALKGFMKTKDSEAAKKEALLQRDLKVAREQARLAEKFPRAMFAFSRGKLALPDDPSDEALVAALKAKEEELEELGVPLTPAPPASQSGQQATEPPPDPAAAFGQVQGSQPPGAAKPDPQDAIREAMQSGNRKALIDSIYQAGKGYRKHHDLVSEVQDDAIPGSVV